jgi:hypothetical protein
MKNLTIAYEFHYYNHTFKPDQIKGRSYPVGYN